MEILLDSSEVADIFYMGIVSSGKADLIFQ